MRVSGLFVASGIAWSCLAAGLAGCTPDDSVLGQPPAVSQPSTSQAPTTAQGGDSSTPVGESDAVDPSQAASSDTAAVETTAPGDVGPSSESAAAGDASPTTTSQTQPTSSPTESPVARRLIFEDDFDAGTAPDPAVWALDPASLDGVALDSDHLVLTAIPAAAPPPGEPVPPTVVRAVVTNDRRSFTYGRIEARIQVPASLGARAGFRLLPEDEVYATPPGFDGPWPGNGEIDVIETGGPDPTVAFGGVDLVRDNRPEQDGGLAQAAAPLGDDFHVYAVEWTQDTLTWSIDGEAFHSVDASQPFDGRRPFDQQFYLRLQLTVEPVAADAVPTAAAPVSMLVDWVRVYQ